MLGEQAHRIGAQQLVVADRGRDRPRVLAMPSACLGIVLAIAAGLEGVDADRLFPGEARAIGGFGVGLLELRVGLRPVRHEAECAFAASRNSGILGTGSGGRSGSRCGGT